MATYQLIPTLLANTQKSTEQSDPDYENYETLLAAARKNPFMDKDPAKTAGYLLSAKLSKRVLDRLNALGIGKKGTIYASVRRGGEKLPINKNLDRFADALVNSYGTAPLRGSSRNVYFDDAGQPILLDDENNQFVTSSNLKRYKNLHGPELYQKALSLARFRLGIKSPGLLEEYRKATTR